MGDSGPSDSQVGDDPSTFDDEGVGYGNVDTTTEQFQEDTRQENQRSNIIGDPNYDAQFTADRIENQFGEGTAKNFMSSDTYAQTTQAARDSGLPSVSIDIPSIQAASSNLAPGILGETLSDFQSGVRDDSLAARGMVEGAITPESGPLNMLEAAIASRPTDYSELDLIPTTGFLPAQVTRSDVTSPASAAIANVISDKMNQNVARRFGLGDPRGIDFGVTQQLLPATTPTARPENLRQRFDNAAIQEALEAGTLAENLDRTQDTRLTEEIDDLADTEFARPRETGTTATGAFDPNAIMEEEEKFGTLPGTTLEDIERLSNVPVGQRKAGPGTDPTFLQGMGVPSFISGIGDFIERTSRDRMAARLAKGDVEEKNIVRNADGLVIGIKDAQGNLIEGIDPDAMMQDTGNGGEQTQRRVAPKAATDPCPDGYQLIDGKCTPTGATDTGTGFMMFPTDRTPPFRRGPFTPTTVATNPNIRALNPVTFGLSNIFRR